MNMYIHMYIYICEKWYWLTKLSMKMLAHHIEVQIWLPDVPHPIPAPLKYTEKFVVGVEILLFWDS